MTERNAVNPTNTFECAMCGQCCANQDVIQLTSYELYVLADYLKVPPLELFERCCTVAETSLNAQKHMYIRTADGRCPFLDGRLCSVHPARPYACRAYPMRTPEIEASHMKDFIRHRYPMLEQTCSVFKIDDHDLLIGDTGLLVDQAIAFAADEIYYNMIIDGPADLSIPARVAVEFTQDEATRKEAETFILSGGKSPMFRAIGRMAMTLQAIAWGTTITLIREPSRVTLEHATKPGNYVLASTDQASVDAVKYLITNPSLYCKAFSMASAPGKMLVSAAYASPEQGLAVGFQLELEAASIKEMTWDGTTPLYVFFIPEDGSAEQAVGLTLNVDQL
ncbi:MAG: YkgJ family cysteine cluster protein [Methanocella sp.]